MNTVTNILKTLGYILLSLVLIHLLIRGAYAQTIEVKTTVTTKYIQTPPVVKNQPSIPHEDDKSFEPIGRRMVIGPRSYIEELIESVFGEEADTAKKVAFAESGMRHDAISWTGCCVGVFQIHEYAHRYKIPATTREDRIEWLKDVENNIKTAKQIYDTSGWYPWEVCTKEIINCE